MNQEQYQDKIEELKWKREKKRRAKRIRYILNINLGLIAIISLIFVIKNLASEIIIDARRNPKMVEKEVDTVETELPEIREISAGQKAISLKEGSFVHRGFPVQPDRDPESITAIINKDFPLPSDYIPKDLVVPNVTLCCGHDSEKSKLRKPAADALYELFEAAKEEGILLHGVSGYRSFKRQSEIYYGNVKHQGILEASVLSAVPGTSEHQSGLSMDISCKANKFDLTEEFGEMKEGRWVAENAHKYGFIIRYRKDKTEITGYSYEPWHLRYVGKDLSAFLYEKNISLEEYYGLSIVKE